jgi:prepilin-type N-terminal cleavage/methylation domain-containing protein
MRKTSKQAGFSIIELLLVLVATVILSSIALISLKNNQLLSVDNQAKKIIDIFDEARQKALNQRQTMRVEISRTRGLIRIIDENLPASVNDDVEVRRAVISTDITVGVTPGNVVNNPTTTSPIPIANYETTSYPLSSGEEKITLRFRRNGQVVNIGTDNVGTNSIVTGATVFLTSNQLTTSINGNAAKPQLVRAVTVLGSSGDTSLMKCQINASGDCVSWYK